MGRKEGRQEGCHEAAEAHAHSCEHLLAGTEREREKSGGRN